MAKETLNMISVNVEEFTSLVRDNFQLGYGKPVLCLGPSGIGKTESIANEVISVLRKEMQSKIGFVALRLGSFESTDLTGIPQAREVVRSDGSTDLVAKFANMDLLPNVDRDGKRGILVLDEFTTAPVSVRSVALQLLDCDRGVGGYILPEGWSIVILGNGPDDGGMFQGLEYALISRALCFRMEPNFTVWKNWALKNKVHPTVISFIEEYGGTEMLHKISENEDYEKKECNPRSWVSLSDLIKLKEKSIGRELPERMIEIYSGGAVGADLASQFATFYAFSSELIPMDSILTGEACIKYDIGELKTEILYIQNNMLVQKIKELCELPQVDEAINNGQLPERDILDQILNILRWVLKVGEYKFDLLTPTLSSMIKASDNFSTLMNSSDFDEVFPELLEFNDKHGTAYSIIGAIGRATS